MFHQNCLFSHLTKADFCKLVLYGVTVLALVEVYDMSRVWLYVLERLNSNTSSETSLMFVGTFPNEEIN